MSILALENIEQDTLAMSVARAVAISNESAISQGIDLAEAMVSVSEESPPPARVWRVHYGPRNYVNRRGGDFIVLIDDRAGVVQRVIRGQ